MTKYRPYNVCFSFCIVVLSCSGGFFDGSVALMSSGSELSPAHIDPEQKGEHIENGRWRFASVSLTTVQAWELNLNS